MTYVAEPGMKAVSEVISVTVTGPATDPCGSITPGTPIVFDKMRVGYPTSTLAGPTPGSTGSSPALALEGVDVANSLDQSSREWPFTEPCPVAQPTVSVGQ